MIPRILQRLRFSPLTGILVLRHISEILVAKENKSQSLYGEFGTLTFEVEIMCEKAYQSQSPSGDFGNVTTQETNARVRRNVAFQSPYGDFGTPTAIKKNYSHARIRVSVPLRGFW